MQPDLRVSRTRLVLTPRYMVQPDLGVTPTRPVLTPRYTLLPDLAFCGMFGSPEHRKHLHTYAHVKGTPPYPTSVLHAPPPKKKTGQHAVVHTHTKKRRSTGDVSTPDIATHTYAHVEGPFFPSYSFVMRGAVSASLCDEQH
eukprot:2502587-Rhodomonas_salina.6